MKRMWVRVEDGGAAAPADPKEALRAKASKALITAAENGKLEEALATVRKAPSRAGTRGNQPVLGGSVISTYFNPSCFPEFCLKGVFEASQV